MSTCCTSIPVSSTRRHIVNVQGVLAWSEIPTLYLESIWVRHRVASSLRAKSHGAANGAANQRRSHFVSVIPSGIRQGTTEDRWLEKKVLPFCFVEETIR